MDLEKLARETTEEVGYRGSDEETAIILAALQLVRRSALEEGGCAVAEKEKEITRLTEACRKEFETVERLDALQINLTAQLAEAKELIRALQTRNNELCELLAPDPDNKKPAKGPA